MNTLHSFDEVFDTQAVFRKVLEAMSNPARTVSIASKRADSLANIRNLLPLL
jgi:alpha-D-ribose 1-methylphosphonate 5-triphosphate synthase subunit PhnH